MIQDSNCSFQRATNSLNVELEMVGSHWSASHSTVIWFHVANLVLTEYTRPCHDDTIIWYIMHGHIKLAPATRTRPLIMINDQVGVVNDRHNLSQYAKFVHFHWWDNKITRLKHQHVMARDHVTSQLLYYKCEWGVINRYSKGECIMQSGGEGQVYPCLVLVACWVGA